MYSYTSHTRKPQAWQIESQKTSVLALDWERLLQAMADSSNGKNAKNAKHNSACGTATT